ncbi:unnamed protein product, partial [Effrenium voratum]
DAVGCAESVRVISKAQQIKAFLSDDEDARSLQPEVMVTQELEKAKASSDRAAQAILYLALCEILSFGTADKGAPSRAMRDKALEAGNEAADLFQGLAETRMQALAKLEVSLILSKGASPKSAFQAASEALELLDRLGDKQGMGRALYAIAVSHVVAKDYAAAMTKGLEALELVRAAGDKRAEVVLLQTLVSWGLVQDKPHKALVMAKEAMALQLELQAPPLEEAKACLLLVDALAGVKKVRRGLKAAEECLDRLKKAGDRANVIGLVVVARAQLKRDHPELALTAMDEAIDIAREMGDRRLELLLQYSHAEVNVQLQSRADALEAAEEAAAIAQELRDAREEGDAEILLLSVLVRGTLDRASLVKALAAAKKARGLYQRAEYRMGEATALLHRASILGVDSASSSAQEMLQVATEAHDIFEEEEFIAGQSAALQQVAEAQLAKEGYDEAAQAARDRRAMWKGLGCRKEEGDAVLQLARIYLGSTDYDAAEKSGLEAQKIFQEVGDKAAESVACVHLAQACLKKMSSEAEGETKEALASASYRNSAEKAMRAANDAITACRHLNSKQLRAGALFWRAQVLGFRGRLEEAFRVVMDAEKCFESIAAGSAMVQCKVLAADCLAGLKHYDEAKEVVQQALKQAAGLHDRQAETQAKSCLERIDKAEKKSKEVVAPPVQQAIAAETLGHKPRRQAGPFALDFRVGKVGTGAADIEYEQFMKAKEVQRAMFQAENKTIVHQCADTDIIEAAEGSVACIDGNQAAAHVAYALSDCAFIYPITPSSPMGEMVDEWAAQGLINCYGQKLSVTEMQSEAGAAGALHGSLKAGALGTTFTASQGLLLMIPNMYKIAGELLPCVMHVAARALAGQALSIFGDHSDVMACRATGWAMLASESVEMAQVNALVAHLVSMERRVPVQHFFDGFRTSHEVNKVKLIDYQTMKSFIDWDAIKEHHDLAMNPRHPHVQGTSQGPDIFFQCVEAGNTFYDGLADLFEEKGKLVQQKTGLHFALYGYEGHPEAKHVIVVMGSAAVTCGETAQYLSKVKGQRVGVLKVRLFRPWDSSRFLAALPKMTERICVLDRTKEPGSQGEPLLLEVASTLHASAHSEIVVVGGRYGLGSKEFTPNQVLSVFENLAQDTPKPRFTVGIQDDVTHLSLPVGPWLNVLPEGTTECMFYGLGSDGTVGANKSAVKMIALGTQLHAQAYFEYDAKKSGGVTISHLRFGPQPIHAPYNVRAADYLAIHKSSYVQNYDMTRYLKENAVCVINCSWEAKDLEKQLPAKMRRDLAERKAKLFIIDATKIAVKAGLGKRINMIMQTVFFKLSAVMPYEEAVEMLKKSIKKMYGKKGDKVVKMNIDGVDASIEGIVEIEVPNSWASLAVEGEASGATAQKVSYGKGPRMFPEVQSAEQFAKQVQGPCNNLDGNALPVSAFMPGGRVPLGTSQYEKRGIAIQVPQVDMDKCTQCNKCSLICPHAAVRPFLVTSQELLKAPPSFQDGSRGAIGGGVLDSYRYRIQVSPWDCTGCELCVRICPADALALKPAQQMIQEEAENWDFAVALPERGEEIDKTTVKGSQFQKPFLEFSGACEGCGETPHVKLMTQLFGERLVIANATGCSSIWGASNPSFPYTVNSKGEGPAWANSLFEDNAEFGFGMRKAFKQRRDYLALQVEDALQDSSVQMSEELRQALQQYLVMRKEQMHDLLLPKGRSIYHQIMEKLVPLLEKEKGNHTKIHNLFDLEDMFGRSSFWIVGGDGWAYDIGYGGLDHVIASEEHVNILVLDTEMYSNTGGQASKATPKGAMAKFAESGKVTQKKELGQMAMTYKNVYVASICVHVNPQQAVRALIEADAYPGPSLILAYTPCISQGFPMAESIQHCQMAVDSGYWPLYRFNPELAAQGNNAFQLDSRKIKGDLFKFLAKENRFAAVMRRDPKHAEELDKKLQENLMQKNHLLQVLNKEDLEGQFSKLVEGLSDAKSSESAVTVLYGSETGNAEEQAKNLVQDLHARGLKAAASSLDDFEFEELPNQKILILVVSTCGLGEYPANCKQTWLKLQSELPMSWLSGVKFCVFGLGDSTYSQFCVAAAGFDTRLGELGGQRMLQRGVGDDRDEDRYYTGWEAWLPELWKTLGAPALPLSQDVPVPSYRVDVSAGGKALPVADDDIVPPGASRLTLLTNSVLTGDAKYDRDIRHYEFKIEGTNVSYKTGESLAIWPRNPKDKVLEFCEMMGLDASQHLRVLPLEGARNWCPTELSVRQLFSHVLDIFGKPNRKFFETLSLFAKDESERSQLRSIVENSKDGAALYRDLTHDFAHHADVFKRFASARPPLEHLLQMMPVLKPRSYSIASSPLMHPDKIQLCVVLVDWTVESTKELRLGECTGYMQTQPPGAQIMCAVRSSAIVLPQDAEKPVIMAGMGTGLAPWRAVTQERVMQKRSGLKVGKCMLFFGARYKVEWLYREEFETYEKEGVLQMHCAFSREQARKIYVQHRIVEAGQDVAECMLNQGGHFYVCGSARQVPEDIYTAMKEVMMTHERCGEEDAEAILSNLKMEGRYTVEAWS